MINLNSILVAPRVAIDRTKLYNRVQDITLSTANDSASAAITVPFDIFITGMSVRVYANDADDKTLAVVESDANRDQFKFYLKVLGMDDFMSGAMDTFSFNRLFEGDSEFQGFILRKNTDITLECTHSSNGTAQMDAPFRFSVAISGYRIVGENALRA